LPLFFAEFGWLFRRYTALVTHDAPHYSWFGGGELSMCHNAVDRHLKDRADQAAIIYDSPVLGIVRIFPPVLALSRVLGRFTRSALLVFADFAAFARFFIQAPVSLNDR